MHDIANRLIAGAAAGSVATGPMTLLMTGLHKELPRQEQYPLPPRQITMAAAEAVDLENQLSEPEKQALTLAAHFGYGAGAGALYGAVAPHIPFSPVANGIVYGLAVWTGSYLGWLPAAGILPPATEEPARRNALMIGAHVLWGAVLGWTTNQLLKDKGDSHE